MTMLNILLAALAEGSIGIVMFLLGRDYFSARKVLNREQATLEQELQRLAQAWQEVENQQAALQKGEEELNSSRAEVAEQRTALEKERLELEQKRVELEEGHRALVEALADIAAQRTMLEKERASLEQEKTEVRAEKSRVLAEGREVFSRLQALVSQNVGILQQEMERAFSSESGTDSDGGQAAQNRMRDSITRLRS